MMTAWQVVIERVTVIGLGKVGELVATLLHLGGSTCRHRHTRQAGSGVPTTTTDVRNARTWPRCSTRPTRSCRACRTTELAVAEAAAATETHYFDLNRRRRYDQAGADLAAGSAVPSRRNVAWRPV